MDPFAEFDDPTGEVDPHEFLKHIQTENFTKSYEGHRRRKENPANMIPLFEITEEMKAKRKMYDQDYVLAHRELFPMSTGVKPYGEEQEKAVRRFQRIVHTRGKLVQAEPRGFGKTSRAVNQLLLGILEGRVRFALVVSSAIDKAEDIMEQIATELTTNHKLAELYPTVMACFKAIEGKPNKAALQNIEGNPTKIQMTTDTISFPVIPGEPCSGATILVKTKENVRGLSKRIRAGEFAGKGERPDFILLDDIQTDKDARSPTVCAQIATTIKRSALFGGSHTKKVRAVITITPNRKGDVASHFMVKEKSWEVAKYPMLIQMPKNMELWEEYAAILLNFDKYIEGDREKAQIRAKQFVLDNYDALHEGAIASWEWAYDWESGEDSIEVSAVHHAMTILYEEGEEAFNYECQCVLAEDSQIVEATKATMDQIMCRQSHLSRYTIPAGHLHIVTHVDCNKDFLSYVTATSGLMMEPQIIDYGVFPPQDTDNWTKRNIVHTFARRYRDIDREDTRMMIYTALKEFIPLLAKRVYQREDNATFSHRLIGVDINYELDSVVKAMRESEHRSMLIGTQGISYKAKDKPMAETKAHDRELHYHCYSTLTGDKTMPLLRIDTNFIKTFIHKGFIAKPGTPGSYKLFQPEYPDQHLIYATHLISEEARRDHYDKEDRTLDIWLQDKGKDNEFFDNTVGVSALLFRLGCHLKSNTTKKAMNMQDYMEAQKSKKNSW